MSKKMYCIVRTDLKNSSYIACQGGHAIAQYFIDHGMHAEWNNGTMVYLAANNEQHLLEIKNMLNMNDLKHSYFIEPDIGNEYTAISCISDGLIFKKLKLL